MNDTENKRRSFRLDDQLDIWFRKIDEADLDEMTENFDQFRMQYCLKSHFTYQKEARTPNMQVLKKRDREVAFYIEHLERQIIKLAERLDTSANKSENRFEQRVDVNLSADGVRFVPEKELNCGEHLELGMELPSYEMQIYSVAKVVRCSGLSIGRQEVSLEFTHLHEEDKEAIIRHLAKLQQRQLQARREA